jgi:alpha-amylase
MSFFAIPPRRAIPLILLLIVTLVGTLSCTIGNAPPPVAPGPRTVYVHLFEWKWADIAQECESFLGPKGYAAVQVSPPQEHIVATGNPWWQRYQPVSYRLDSRSGTRAEFADMVRRCKAVGVDIYADAVINHMAGVDSGTGNAGSSFTHYDYPGIYQFQDFHHCGLNPNDDIMSYSDRGEVQNCELLNLADLNTGAAYVQDRLAAYMNDMLSLGVTGFRIDASKHIDTNELKTILGKLNNRTDGERPYIYQEVIEGGREPIKASEYVQNGDVTEFKYGTLLGLVFRAGKLDGLREFGMTPVFLPSNAAIVFTDNHDNQRGHGGADDVITFKDGKLYNLANTYVLAWPYGYPQIMSSYNFDNSDQGPPSNPDGSTMSIYTNGVPDCFNGRWVCEHRWQDLAGMVGFRNYTASRFEVTDWWSNGNAAIAFGRGDRGFVIINREDAELNNIFQTSMPAGQYCDVTKGELAADGRTCTGPTVTVNDTGQITVTVGGMSAVAIHGGAKVSGP